MTTISDRLDSFIAEVRFRFDRIDAELAAMRLEMETMHARADVIAAKLDTIGKRPALREMLAKSDPTAQWSEESQQWLNMPSVGREII